MAKVLRTLKRTLNRRHEGAILTVSLRNKSAWTSDGIIKSPYKDIQIPNCTLNDYVWQNLDKWPQRTVSVCAVTGRGYTYEQAFKLSNTFAANLRLKLKIRDGDVVAIMLPNIPDYPLVAMGILGAGGVITSINPIYTAHEVHRQLLLATAKVIVTLPEIVNVVKEALKLAKMDIPIIVVKTNGQTTPEGTIVFNDLSEDVHVDKSCLKEVRRSVNDICFLPYSSGTTGLPKGVELTNSNIIANCEQMNDNEIKSHNETTATHQDVMLAVLPFFHIYAASALMFHKMSHGIKLVTMSKLQPDHFFVALEKYKVNLFFVAPPLVLLMASHPAGNPKTYESLETVMNGAAPVAPADVERLFSKVQRKIRFSQGYGLTETSPAICISPAEEKDCLCAGPPLGSTDLKIVDNDLKLLGPNQPGEILVRGPQVMKGYRNNPEENAKVLLDGWFRTGDVGVADERGALKIVDRLKELIKVKGFQVPPAELEAIIREHPTVKDVAVIGVPHPTKGECPRAYVVLENGKNADLKEITAFVNSKVAPFKQVDEIVVLDAIPKSASGKILKKDLKAQYC